MRRTAEAMLIVACGYLVAALLMIVLAPADPPRCRDLGRSALTTTGRCIVSGHIDFTTEPTR